MGPLPLDITTLAPEQAPRRRVANVNDYPQYALLSSITALNCFSTLSRRSLSWTMLTIGAGLSGNSGGRDMSMEFYGSRTGPKLKTKIWKVSGTERSLLTSICSSYMVVLQ